MAEQRVAGLAVQKVLQKAAQMDHLWVGSSAPWKVDLRAEQSVVLKAPPRVDESALQMVHRRAHPLAELWVVQMACKMVYLKDHWSVDQKAVQMAV